MKNAEFFLFFKLKKFFQKIKIQEMKICHKMKKNYFFLRVFRQNGVDFEILWQFFGQKTTNCCRIFGVQHFLNTKVRNSDQKRCFNFLEILFDFVLEFDLRFCLHF